jgi:hypothetical protein
LKLAGAPLEWYAPTPPPPPKVATWSFTHRPMVINSPYNMGVRAITIVAEWGGLRTGLWKFLFTFEIFILKNKIFLKILHFPSQKIAHSLRKLIFFYHFNILKYIYNSC